MKRFVILLLALVLLSAQLPTSQPAYYSSVAFGPSLLYKTWHNFDASWFTDQRPGVVNMQGQTWIPTTTDGLINLSGTCSIKNLPGVWVMNLTAGGVYYRLVYTNQLTASFSVAVPASDIQISVYQESPYGANTIKCTLLFEPVY